MKYAYIRVSTIKQDYERQEYAIRNCGVPKENIYCETISGTKKASSRPEFEKLLSRLQKGDTVYFESMSRMSRSVLDMVETSERIVKTIGATVIFLKENLTLSIHMDSTSSLMFNIFASFAQFERDIISERTKELIAAKRALLGDEFKIGREKSYSDEDIYEVMCYKEDGYTISKIAEMTGISRSAVGRITKGFKGIEKNQAVA
jgi:DNA invertase Pin-like site-specific DNA recombinase